MFRRGNGPVEFGRFNPNDYFNDETGDYDFDDEVESNASLQTGAYRRNLAGSHYPSMNSVNGAEGEAGEAATAAASTAEGISGAAVGGLAFLGSSIISGASGLIAPVIQEHEQEKLAKFQYGMSKQAASDSGMPLANVLGFGSTLPKSTSYNGAASITTSGQGIKNVPFIGTQSQVTSGYGTMW